MLAVKSDCSNDHVSVASSSNRADLTYFHSYKISLNIRLSSLQMHFLNLSNTNMINSAFSFLIRNCLSSYSEFSLKIRNF